MNIQDTIRSWKDDDFRVAASNAGLAVNPAGLVELHDNDLDLNGGRIIGPDPTGSWWGCPTGDFVPCETQFICTYDVACWIF